MLVRRAGLKGKNCFRMSKLGREFSNHIFMDREGMIYVLTSAPNTPRCAEALAFASIEVYCRALSHPDFDNDTKEI